MEKYKLKQVDIRLKLASAKPLYSTEPITTPKQAIKVMAEALIDKDREYCLVVNLDNANHPINFNIVSIGDINQTQVPIQNLFKSAILSNAARILAIHNHLSGSVNPSEEDHLVTQKMVMAGGIMNIPLTDHIIVSNNTDQFCSFRTDHPEYFQKRGN